MATKYPLEEVLDIKKRRFDESVRVLEAKKELLESEEKKLKQLEEKRDEALKHKNDKLTQLREALDTGQGTIKIQEMKRYLETVESKLEEHQKKVDEQKEQVELAQKQVEIAKQDMIQKQKDLEKLRIHKKEWLKEHEKEERRQEEIKHDELGTVIHEIKKRENPHKKS